MRHMRNCSVEIISIGNELLLGNTINTNASWVASQVTSLGAKVTRITAIPDDLDQISHVIREAIRRRPAFVITTGGIGPTFDDMTLRGIARALRVRLKPDRSALKMIREHYALRFPGKRLNLTKPRLKMASIPSGGMAVRNPVGTAPGVKLKARGTEIFCLPGVPREAKAIFRDSISPSVSSRTAGAVFMERWIDVRGIMESMLAPMIDQVMRRWPGVYIKSHPRGIEMGGRPRIKVHFSIGSSNVEKAKRALLGAMHELSDKLVASGAKIASVR
jgi:molybdenum cofactor synthesis domain-containing protein